MLPGKLSVFPIGRSFFLSTPYPIFEPCYSYRKSKENLPAPKAKNGSILQLSGYFSLFSIGENFPSE